MGKHLFGKEVEAATDRFDVHQVALKFLADHERNLVVYHNGGWWEYTGDCYRQIPADYLDGRLRLWLRQNGVLPRPHLLSNLLGQLRAVTYIDPGLSMPCWLGEEDPANPGPDQVVAFANGLLDVGRFLEAGEAVLLPHTHRWFSASCLPYPYDPAADCPRWRQFLAECLVDDDQIALLQTWCGYCLTLDNRLQKFLFLLGPTRSGKSTTLNVLTDMVGRKNVAGVTLQSMSSEFGLADLLGKQAATISEIHLGRDTRNLVQALKNITGGDPVPVNRKGLPVINCVLPVRFTIAANQLPRLPDDSNALKSRMLLLHYPTSFLGREDPELGRALAGEIPGIANWALAGLRQLHRQGRFLQAERGMEFLEDFGNLSAPVAQFLADHCEEGAGLWEPTDYLFEVWKIWCHQEGYEAGAKNTFGAKLKAARPAVRNQQRRTAEGRKVRCYAGVELNSDGVDLLATWSGKPAVAARCKARLSQAVSG